MAALTTATPQLTRELAFMFLRETYRNGDFVIGRAKATKRQAFIPHDAPAGIVNAVLNGTAEEKTIASDWFTDNGLPRPDGFDAEGDLPFPIGQEFAVKGNATPADLVAGNEYLGIGKFERHDKYGWGFNFSSVGPTEPVTRTGVVRYLQQFKGIGPERATALFNRFRAFALVELRRDPEKAYEACPQAFPSLEFAKEASEHFRKLAASETTKIELLELLGKRGFGATLIDRLLHDHGAGAVKLVRENPFSLTRYRGVGFLKADNLWKHLGLPLEDLRRQTAFLRHWVESDATGSTWHAATRIATDARKTFDGPAFDFDAAMARAIEARQLVEFVDAGDHRWIATQAGDLAERRAAGILAELSRGESLWSALDLPDLTDHQTTETREALAGAVGILTGRAGCGKTWCVARIVAQLEAIYGPSAIMLGAPTGKAAQRMRQSLSQFGLTYEARTIHSMLGLSFERGEGRFLHGPDNPLPAKFFIIDEASMLDVLLFASFLRALPDGAHVLFVGDTHQLPPVGHGAPLRDMIAAGLPCGELIEVHRNAGRGLQCANAVLEGRPRTYSSAVDLAAESPENLLLIDPKGRGTTPENVVAIMSRMVEKGYVESFSDIVVLTATNAVRKAINERIQELVNPQGVPVADTQFRVGDRVIFLKNDRLSDARRERAGEVPVFNGEFGHVREFGDKSMVVALADPTRLVRVPFGKQKEPEHASDDDFTSRKLCDLGYGVTTHKMQGSSSPATIVVLEDSYSTTGKIGICDRAWFYTAITRFERLNVLLGSDATIEKMVRKQNQRGRKTFFGERLREAMPSVAMTATATVDDFEF